MVWKIIGLTGNAHAGKDTVARCIFTLRDVAYHYNIIDETHYIRGIKNIENSRRLHETFCLSFACLIYEAVSSITNKDIPYIIENKNSDYLPGITYRHLLQTLGTDWGRNTINPDLWLKGIQERINFINPNDQQLIVITDVRFNNEADFIIKQGGMIWEVQRDNLPTFDHESEQGIDRDKISHTITNNGTIDDLYTKVRDLLIQHNLMA